MGSRTLRPLRIGMVAPPWYSIPPEGYGGIEWMCHWLTEGLVRRGHQVFLVAAGESSTSARFYRTFEEPPTLRLGEALPELLHTAHAVAHLASLELDLVHDHTLAGPIAAAARPVPTVATAHARADGEPGEYLRAVAGSVHLVAISDSQRGIAPDLPWLTTIHNGIPVREYPYAESKEGYALFLGRMNPDKGVHIAIDAAREADLEVIVAGKMSERVEREYFESEIQPRLRAGVEWIGHADSEAKKRLLRDARCLLFPIQWEEPFGIVMAEALACGTPIVALRRGSVPEVVTHDVTGFICGDPGELPDAIKRVGDLDPQACRQRALDAFDAGTMVERYESVYRDVLGG